MAIQTSAKLLSAAQQVFSEKGFSGARVDEIARRARANKAMIYYHFGAKEDLYHAVLLRLFAGVLDEVERISQEVKDPHERLQAFYTALIRIFTERADLPRIMMREVLAGGTHMDKAVVEVLGAILRFVAGAVTEGVAQGAFRPLSPLLVHLTLFGPILVYFVSAPFRERLLPEAFPGAPLPGPDLLAAHLVDLLTRLLVVDAGGSGAQPRSGGSPRGAGIDSPREPPDAALRRTGSKR